MPREGALLRRSARVLPECTQRRRAPRRRHGKALPEGSLRSRPRRRCSKTLREGDWAPFEDAPGRRQRRRAAEGALRWRSGEAIFDGLMIRQTGDTMITAPPLVCNQQEIDSLVETLGMALDQTAGHFGIK